MNLLGFLRQYLDRTVEMDAMRSFRARAEDKLF
jgi:hypothetical protein